MYVVDYCKSKTDFGRIDIEPDPEGYWSDDLLAAMTAIGLENDGYQTITKQVEKE